MSDPNSPTTVGSDHLGFGDFSCSSSEVGDQVFVGIAQEVVGMVGGGAIPYHCNPT